MSAARQSEGVSKIVRRIAARHLMVAGLLLLAIIAYCQITIFTVQPDRRGAGRADADPVAEKHCLALRR